MPLLHTNTLCHIRITIQLKKKHTVHNTQQRVENVKQFADMVRLDVVAIATDFLTLTHTSFVP